MSQVMLHDCPQCGNALTAGALFCGKCGYALPKGENTSQNAMTGKLSLSAQSSLPLPEEEAEQPEVPTSLFDTRYPRPFWYRILRRLGIMFGTPFALLLGLIIEPGGWIAFFAIILLLYSAGAIFSFINHGFKQSDIVPALLFIVNSDWWKVLLFLLALSIAIFILILSSWAADDDLKREKAEIKERVHSSSFTLRYVLRPGQGITRTIAWSPNGQALVSSGYSRLLFWQAETGKLLSTIENTAGIESIAWSPDGNSIAVIQNNGNVNLWNVQNGEKEANFSAVTAPSFGYKIAWSSDAKTLALTAQGRDVTLLDRITGQTVDLPGFSEGFSPAIAWMPNENKLAVYADNGLQLWDTETRQLSHKPLNWKSVPDNAALAWSPNGSILAASDAGIILLWDPSTGQQIGSLEGSLSVIGLSFSCDGRLLAAKKHDRRGNGDIQIWRTDTWDLVATFSESSPSLRPGNYTRIAFHPTKPNILATCGLNDTIIRVWGLELAALLSDPSRTSSPSPVNTKPPVRIGNPVPAQAGRIGNPTWTPADFLASTNRAPADFLASTNRAPADFSAAVVQTAMVRYTNAKVVLLGDSGVGKSGLGLVLSQQPFVPTESTHGRHVWTFASDEVLLPNGRKETRETLLWDLAGQPGYRLIHQLYLNEVTVALIVIDARSETDPFAGVYHWDRALRQAQHARGSSGLSVKKFLVAARIDRSGIGVSRARIEGMLRELGFAGYFETSAKDGRGIQELKTAIEAAINWENLPWVISTRLFQQIKDFLVAEKEAGRVLSTVDDLYRSFLRAKQVPTEIDDLRVQFETCIGRVESRGLIRQLSFGNLVLLQPELLDAYASALVNEVRDEPDGLGSIPEERVITARFTIPADGRLKDREQEKVLLIAMTEDLLRYELALREQADDGQYLVFPSQSTRENPDLPDPEGKAMTFSFEGPVQNIYATLAVRLSHSGFFKKKELWKNAIAYTTQRGGTCGVFLQHTGEGQGRLTLFFDQEVSSERRADFEAYIETHLQRKALPESIQCRYVLACNHCHTLVTEETIQKRQAQGLDWLNCPVCDQRVSLLQEERPGKASSIVVRQMDEQADVERNLQTAVSVVQGKTKMQDFDVFLCHHGTDKPAVKRIGERLKQYGILPWLDEWELRPGMPWQRLLEEQIAQIKSAAVFVGPAGIGPWQHQELDAFLREFVHRGVPVIPVLLPDAPKEPRLPIFLSGMTWVDFRRQEPDPMQRLLWGITGSKY